MNKPAMVTITTLIPVAGGKGPIVKLSPTMTRAWTIAQTFGSVSTADGFTVGTLVALMDRGLIREADPHHDGRHYPATDRDAVHAEALAEHYDRAGILDKPNTPRARHFAAAILEHERIEAVMDALHVEALEMDRRWENADLHPRAGTITNGTASHRNVARFRQDPYSFSGSQSDIEAARQHLAEQIERDHAAAIEEHEERLCGRVHLGTLTGPSGIACDAEARGMASGSTPHRANVTCPDCLAVEPAVATAILHDFDCASMPAPGTADDGIPAGQEPRCTCSADPS